MAHAAPLVDRFVVGVDIETYSSRDIRLQGELQEDLVTLLEEAAEAAGIGRHRWDRLPGGDGELAVLPPDIDLVAVVGHFVTRLDDLLTAHNRDRVPQARMRLRVAMHTDVLRKAELGYAGPALNVLARLLDAQPGREALKLNGGAQLVLVVSDALHRKVVSAGFPGIRPERFRYVRIQMPGKGFDEAAYIHVPGHGVPTVAGDPPPDAPPPSPGPAPTETGPDHGGPVLPHTVGGDFVRGDYYEVSNPHNQGTIYIGGRSGRDRGGQ